MQQIRSKINYIELPLYIHTVHDTENLTFSAEFRDCSARNDAEFPRGCRGTSARVDADLPCGFGLKMAKTRR